MQIIARRGNQFIITDAVGNDPNPPGKLVDLDQGIATAMPVQQALKWGYWEEPGTLSPATLKLIEAVAA